MHPEERGQHVESLLGPALLTEDLHGLLVGQQLLAVREGSDAHRIGESPGRTETDDRAQYCQAQDSGV